MFYSQNTRTTYITNSYDKILEASNIRGRDARSAASSTNLCPGYTVNWQDCGAAAAEMGTSDL